MQRKLLLSALGLLGLAAFEFPQPQFALAAEKDDDDDDLDAEDPEPEEPKEAVLTLTDSTLDDAIKKHEKVSAYLYL